MTTLIERIDDTRSHLTRESLALVTRTRRAGDGLAKAVVGEASEWQTYFVTQRDVVRTEVARLSSPRGIERAALRLADGALARAHETVHARLARIERELSRVSSKTKTKKVRPSARSSAKVAGRSSRRLVTDPTPAS